jgi:hypothetical protein
MTYRTRLALRGAPGIALLCAGAVAAPQAIAAPAAVDLRVEGASSTIYEDRITTDGHNVTTASGGTHKCDGTNGGVNPTPGPSATAALDDGARLGGFTWDGTYDSGFDDYLISRIGPDSQTSSQFWALLVNSSFSNVGGCQQRVKQGDEVLWAFDGFSKQHPLRLTGPGSATTNRPFSVRVTDGANGSAIAGAAVRGSLSGADGRASVTLASKGIYRLKATRADSIRSNALEVCADPPGAAPCTSFDSAAPHLRLMLPGLLASDTARSRTIDLDWRGDDGAGSGVTTYDLEARQTFRGVGDRHFAGWRSLADDTELTTAHFRGASGAAYEFRLSALDRARNEGVAGGGLVFPVDDRDRRLLRLSRRGWKRLKRRAAWGRQVIRSRKRGARLRFRFRGRRVALIGRELPNGGRLRVTIDGRSRTVDLEGEPDFRDVLFLSARRDAGTHTLRLRAVGGGPVELDAIAPLPR